MASHHRQLRGAEPHLVEIGDGATRLGVTQEPRVAGLVAKRHAGHNAGHSRDLTRIRRWAN
jgi:hypothetical protein